jgi:hypothetical protein
MLFRKSYVPIHIQAFDASRLKSVFVHHKLENK